MSGNSKLPRTKGSAYPDSLRRSKRSYTLQKFARDRNGNIAILFVFMSTVLFLFVGGAVDYTRWNSVRADMIESMDAASLAVAQLQDADGTLTPADLEEYGEKFFKENFDYETVLKTGWDIKFDLSDDAVVATCIVGKLDTFLLGVAGIYELNIDKCVEITPQGSGRIELAMVLDVTGSMGWNDSGGTRKMDSLETAVTALLDVLFEEETESNKVKIGVVPFNQHVSAGGATSWLDSWGDLDAEAPYHGARFFHVDENGVIDASTKVNHYALFDSDPRNDWEGCLESRPYPLDELDTVPGDPTTVAFLSAAMQTPSVADESDSNVRDAFANAPDIDPDLSMAILASSESSRFVPVFLPDDPDCNSSRECYSLNDVGTSSLYDADGTLDGIAWDSEWFTDPDDDPVLTFVQESAYPNPFNVGDRRITDYTIGTGFEKYVPVVHQFREVINNNATNPGFEDWLDRMRVTDEDQEYIVRSGYPGWWDPGTETYLYKFQYSENNSDQPNPQDCPEPILPLTNVRSKIDGPSNVGIMDRLTPNGGTNIPNGIIWGWRTISPDAPFTESIGPGETGPNGSEFEDWQKAVLIMTDGNNDFSDRSTHWGSSPSSYGFEVEERMGDGINEADQNGVPNMEDEADEKILRICRRMKEESILVYTIVFDVSAGSAIEDVFKSCASQPEAPYFFNAPDGSELEEAFGDIADDLVKLHISK